jgi:hypothetical protein
MSESNDKSRLSYISPPGSSCETPNVNIVSTTSIYCDMCEGGGRGFMDGNTYGGEGGGSINGDTCGGGGGSMYGDTFGGEGGGLIDGDTCVGGGGYVDCDTCGGEGGGSVDGDTCRGGGGGLGDGEDVG